MMIEVIDLVDWTMEFIVLFISVHAARLKLGNQDAGNIEDTIKHIMIIASIYGSHEVWEAQIIGGNSHIRVEELIVSILT